MVTNSPARDPGQSAGGKTPPAEATARSSLAATLRLVARIAIVVFILETLIMFAFAGLQPSGADIVNSFIDAAALTLLSSPIIYFWIIKPYVVARVAAERELRDLAEKLDEARQAADAANAGKSRFLANMSHELRTPLNAIIGFSDLMLNRIFGPIQPDQYRQYVSYIHESGHHLLSLINDMLDLSKVESGRMELHREIVPIAPLAFQTMEVVRWMAEERNVTLDLRLGGDCAILHADPRIAKQILLNLLSNAIKFTPGPGTVTLAADPVEGGIALSVTDTGIGMDTAEAQIALEPYGQIESALTKKESGTGLGLPLAKSLIELHGGFLRIDSTKGVGTTVTVFFPWCPDLSRDPGRNGPA